MTKNVAKHPGKQFKSTIFASNVYNHSAEYEILCCFGDPGAHQRVLKPATQSVCSRYSPVHDLTCLFLRFIVVWDGTSRYSFSVPVLLQLNGYDMSLCSMY